MSDPQQSVWPDGAREAVDRAYRSWWDNPFQACARDLLNAVEPFAQRRIAAATTALRAEVARLREDGERLDWLGRRMMECLTESWCDIFGEQIGSESINLRAAIDAARSAPGGEG